MMLKELLIRYHSKYCHKSGNILSDTKNEDGTRDKVAELWIIPIEILTVEVKYEEAKDIQSSKRTG